MRGFFLSALAALSVATAVQAQQPPVPFNYGFDAHGVATANYPGHVEVTAKGGTYQQSLDGRFAQQLTIKDFGASGSMQSTTGTVAAGTPTLLLASPIDFATGQGIRIDGAGPAFSGAAPTGFAVTTGGTAGTSDYAYTVAAIDNMGGVGAAVAPVQLTTGSATLSVANYNALSWTGTAPIYAVYGGPIQGTVQASISGTTLTLSTGSLQVGDLLFGTGVSGIYVTGHQSGNHWTLSQSASVGLETLNVYLPTFEGFTQQQAWADIGGGATTELPDWFASTSPLLTSQNDFFVTTVASGEATTALTLAANPPTSVANAFVGHDDSAAWTAAVNYALANNRHVIIPASTSCYPVSSGIAWSDTTPLDMTGASRMSSCLKATAAFGSFVFKDDVFLRGGSITDLQFDGSGIVAEGLAFLGGADIHLERLNLYSFLQANLQIGDGVANAQEFSVTDVRADGIWLDGCASPSCYPFTNIWVRGVNNYVNNTSGLNAYFSNFTDDTTAAGNHYVNVHGYNFPVNILPIYSFELLGAQTTNIAYEADGASTADVYVNGSGNTLTGGVFQFDSITPQIGVLIGTGAFTNVVTSNSIFETTLANGVVSNAAVGNQNVACQNVVGVTVNGLATTQLNCGGGASQTALFSVNNNTTPTAGTTYVIPCSGFLSTNLTSPTSSRNFFPLAGVLKNLYVMSNNAPATGFSFTATVFVNSSATALTCTASNTANNCQDTTHTVSVAVGSSCYVQYAWTTGATVGALSVSMEYDP